MDLADLFSFLNIFWKAGNGNWISVRESTGFSFLGITLCWMMFGNILDHVFDVLTSGTEGLMNVLCPLKRRHAGTRGKVIIHFSN